MDNSLPELDVSGLPFWRNTFLIGIDRDWSREDESLRCRNGL